MKNLIVGLTMVTVLASAGVVAHAVEWYAAVSEGPTSADVILEHLTDVRALANTGGAPASLPSESRDWSRELREPSGPDSWSSPPGFQVPGDDRSSHAAVAAIEWRGSAHPIDPLGGNNGFAGAGSPSSTGYIARVAETRPEAIKYDLPWVPDQSTTFGGISTWYDRSLYDVTLVPEPGSLMALAGLGTPLAVSLLRRRRRA